VTVGMVSSACNISRLNLHNVQCDFRLCAICLGSAKLVAKQDEEQGRRSTAKAFAPGVARYTLSRTSNHT
jgi:hypothetical protein